MGTVNAQGHGGFSPGRACKPFGIFRQNRNHTLHRYVWQYPRNINVRIAINTYIEARPLWLPDSLQISAISETTAGHTCFQASLMEGTPERRKLLNAAKLSEQAERYDEMSIAMKKVAEMGCPLSQEERNLLSVAYKNLVGSRRTSWRILNTAVERVDGEKGEAVEGVLKKERRKELALWYTKKIEDELQRICEEVLTLLTDVLLVVTPDAAEAEEVEDRVFYLKMKADYYRYIAEIKWEDAKKSFVDNATAAYKTAMELSSDRLKVLHPIRLGLSLNCSVFYYEILNDRSRACELAQQAYDVAIVELDELNEESYKDSSLILQLLRDNLQFWRDDEEG